MTTPIADIERAVLRCALDGDFLLLEPFVADDSFTDERNRVIWSVFARIVKRGDTLSDDFVLTELKLLGRLEAAGGEAHLKALKRDANVPAEQYGKQLAEATRRRRLARLGQKLVGWSADPFMDLDSLTDKARRELDETTTATGAMQPVSEWLSDYFGEIEKRLTDEQAGLGFGLPFLDEHIALLPQDLMIIGALPSMGKTALMLNMLLARARAVPTEPLVFFSLEMPKAKIVDRLIAAMRRIDLRFFNMARLPAETQQFTLSQIVEGMNELGRLPVYIDDTPMLRVQDIRARLYALKQKQPNLRYAFVDYLGLLHYDRRADSEVVRIMNLLTDLKTLARELDVVLIVAAQLNRNSINRQDKRPGLGDLSYGGEPVADVIAFLYRPVVLNPDYEFPEEAELIIAKNRQGRTGVAKLTYYGAYVTFMGAKQRAID